MALVILGGLVTSTLLNLFVVPALYLRFGKGATRRPTVGDEESFDSAIAKVYAPLHEDSGENR
jgi:hypothetical protein